MLLAIGSSFDRGEEVFDNDLATQLLGEEADIATDRRTEVDQQWIRVSTDYREKFWENGRPRDSLRGKGGWTACPVPLDAVPPEDRSHLEFIRRSYAGRVCRALGTKGCARRRAGNEDLSDRTGGPGGCDLTRAGVHHAEHDIVRLRERGGFFATIDVGTHEIDPDR